MTRAILIDPKERSFTEVEYNGDYKTIYPLLECETFDIAYTDVGDIFVDDEGLINGKDYFFQIKGCPQPLAGRGLLFGPVDDDGESTPATIKIEDLEKIVGFTTRQKLIEELG